MAPEPLDYGLTLLLLALTVRTLFTADLASAIVSFISAGLIAALIWARLAAPDIAIAEAAIGAGITGALLIATWQRLGRPSAPLEQSAALAGVATAAGALFIAAFLALGKYPAGNGLSGLVLTHLEASGVGNPVTAVLLNFRSFDTLMEVAVLFLTIVAVHGLGLRLPVVSLAGQASAAALTRLITPITLLFGAYILWAGADAPGGAFQAGAIWAGGLVLLHLSGRPLFTDLRLSRAATLGLGTFIGAALLSYALSGLVLAYGSRPGTWILVIEVFAALSIAATLFLLFATRSTRDGTT